MYSDVRPRTWRLVLLLAPAVLVLLVLFGGGLAYSLLQSLGWQPLIGRYELSIYPRNQIGLEKDGVTR